MKTRALVLAISLCAASCTTASSVADGDRALPFGCEDVVLIGSLKNGDFQHVAIAGDVIGHGWITATLRVQRIVRGLDVPSVVPVRYLAHTYMRDGRDFMFVAKRSSDGTYVIKAARLVSARPYPVSHCS